MRYQVALAEAAEADAERIYGWVVAQAPVRGLEWFDALIDSVYSLERLPYRCPIAREAKEAKRQIRCLLFGKRPGVYRVLYEIDQDSLTVRILHIRHGALKDLLPDELSPS